jgi:HSP20 family protein
MNTKRRRGDLGNWSPLAELGRLKSEINRILESRAWPSGLGADWLPSMDVYQDKDRITVQAELPGFKREEISVFVHGDSLTISGERKPEQEPFGDEAYQSERFHGRFEREIKLPEEVDAGKASATYKDGVLCVYLPKTEQSKKKQIEVKTD